MADFYPKNGSNLKTRLKIQNRLDGGIDFDLNFLKVAPEAPSFAWSCFITAIMHVSNLKVIPQIVKEIYAFV